MTKLRTSTAIAALATTALTVISSTAYAGGFAIREQSSSLAGMAFAGSATGVDLSSAYWNPAAFGNAEKGLTTESHNTLIVPQSEITGQVVNTSANPFLGVVANTADRKSVV